MSSCHETLSSAALLPCALVMVRIQAAQLTWLFGLQSAGMPQSQSLPEDLNALPACGQVPNAAWVAPRDQMLWLAGAALEQRQQASERAVRPCGGEVHPWTVRQEARSWFSTSRCTPSRLSPALLLLLHFSNELIFCLFEDAVSQTRAAVPGAGLQRVTSGCCAKQICFAAI